MKNTGKLKKLTALITAILLILAAIPVSLALPDNWGDLVTVTLDWQDDEGNWQEEPVAAVPLNEEPGSFFAYLEPGTPVYAIRLDVSYAAHEDWIFETKTDPYTDVYNSIETLLDLSAMDAGDTLDSNVSPYIEIRAYAPDMSEGETFRLYVSSITEDPVVVTPAPEPTEEPTPEPTEECGASPSYELTCSAVFVLCGTPCVWP